MNFKKKKPGKRRENVEYVAESARKMYSNKLFSPELIREKFENDLEISGKTEGIWSLKNVATLCKVMPFQPFFFTDEFEESSPT